MGDCKYCGKSAGFLRSKHRECEQTHMGGLQEMEMRVQQEAIAPNLNKAALLQDLATISQRSWAKEGEVGNSIIGGSLNAVATSLIDGIVEQEVESSLRAFYSTFTLETNSRAGEGLINLNQGVRNRYIPDVMRAALAGDSEKYHGLEVTLRDSGMPPGEQRQVLVEGWEAAVKRVLEDRLPTETEQAALFGCLQRFGINSSDVDTNRAYTLFKQAVVIRDIKSGVLPQEFPREDLLSINIQKTEELVWLFFDVRYDEMRTTRTRRRIENYDEVTYETEEREETVHLDTGLLALTSKHVYFHGRKKSLSIRYDKIVSFDQRRDGFGLMRDAQSAKPQLFRTGDGWFVYNLVTNLARL